LNGRALDYPSPIVAVLDESKGGDALVAWGESVPNLDALKNKTSLKVAFTPNSPSHHLLKAVASHFDMPGLRAAAAAVPSEGSEDALQKFLNKSVDAAVLWEPDVSRALAQEGAVRLLSTADTQGLIVDVLLAGRDLVRARPQVLELVLQNYFKTLVYYRREQPQLLKDLIAHYKVSPSQAEILLQGVEWSSLSDNARYWFGLESQGRQGLVEAVESALAILIDSGDFQDNPLPERDPFRLINSQALQAIRGNASLADLASTRVSADGKVEFTSLDDNQWQALQPVATLKVRPIVFASGAADMPENGREQVAALVRDLQHYPHFRLEVRGHSGLRGDAEANRVLSQKRADEVLRTLHEEFSLDANRARAVGFGSARPLPQQPGESERAYNYRLPRVELVLLEEEI
jgi:outer membrane protein OmpA-like peptidoglycan-associated protein